MIQIVQSSSNAVTEFLFLCNVLEDSGKFGNSEQFVFNASLVSRFNPQARVCDNPKNVPCINNRPVLLTKLTRKKESPVTQPQFPNVPPETTTSPTLDSSSGSGTCKNNGQLIIDGLDCTKFFKCDQGVPIHQECPFGLRYVKSNLI